MRRRSVVIAGGTVAAAFAGCLGSDDSTDADGGTNGTDDDASSNGESGETTDLIEVTVDELLLERADFSDPDWRVEADEVGDTDGFREFSHRSDDDFLDTGASVFDDVAAAMDELEAWADDPETEPLGMDTVIGDESYGDRLTGATVLFRDANAIGSVTHFEHTSGAGGNLFTATTYAERMHEQWRS